MKIALVGAGNLGIHLYREFVIHPEIELVLWHQNKALKGTTEEGVPITSNLNDIPDGILCIMAVPDHTIASVTKQISEKAFVVHTSGASSMDVIIQKNSGVFYPLQSFSSTRSVSFTDLTVCIETRKKEDLHTLETLAQHLKARPVEMDSAKRFTLHLAAVLVNNFTNHLYVQAEQLCHSHDLSFDLLKPLILETAQKIQTLTPNDAQTGPAIRKDEKTISKHLDWIQNTELKKIYSTLTTAINKTNGNKKL
ncbi:MAG: Rossmann-like and DUF2520 domain-containing protein [Flavobacteriaceae bacterium]